MKHKKQCIRMLLLLFYSLFLTACANSGDTVPLEKIENNLQQNTESAAASSEESKVQLEALLPQKLVKVGVVQVGHESDWRIAATESCQEIFSEENGYRLYFIDADNDPKMQVRAVRWFIEQELDYIIVDPILTRGWNAVFMEAYHAKIPVFVIDRTVEVDAAYYQAWFGSDFKREGACAGAWLERYLAGQGREKEPVSIVTITGTLGAAAQLGRTEGFGEYITNNENWTLLDAKSGDFTESGGKKVMEQFLKNYPQIDVVVCQNDNEALGACQAMEEAGLSYGRGGDIVVISFDATRAGLEAVLEGRINADFECNPKAPIYVEEAIRRMEAGEELTGKAAEKFQYLPEGGFIGEKEAQTLWVENRSCRMVPVTEKLLAERSY